jgi:hypothetical protein
MRKQGKDFAAMWLVATSESILCPVSPFKLPVCVFCALLPFIPSSDCNLRLPWLESFSTSVFGVKGSFTMWKVHPATTASSQVVKQAATKCPKGHAEGKGRRWERRKEEEIRGRRSRVREHRRLGEGGRYHL